MSKIKLCLDKEDWSQICNYLHLYVDESLFKRFFFELTMSLEVEKYQDKMIKEAYADLKKSCKPMKKRSVKKV